MTDPKRSELEKLLSVHMENDRIPDPVIEHEFGHGKHRFDFAWPDIKLAAEVEGGTFTGGRHTRGKGFAEDCTKYNIATIDGWRVLRFTADMVREGHARRMIALAIRNHGNG